MKSTSSVIVPLLLIFFFSCNNESSTPQEVKPKGNRRLGFHITTSETNNYDKDFQLARAAGMDAVPLTFIWNSIETGSDWNFEFPDIANGYYPANNVELVLTISPIYAIHKAFPSDLSGLSMDDSKVIGRFNAFLDSLHKHTSAVKYTAIIVGNEVDLYLGDNSAEWKKYKTFYDAARTQIKKLWGNNIRVGIETTFSKTQSATAAEIKTLTANSDVASISYYPLNPDFTMQDPSIVSEDFKKMTEFYSDKPVIIEENGYATSKDCNSSEAKQKKYVEEVFKAWDLYDTKIIFAGFLWLTDLSEEQAEKFVVDYGGSSFPNVIAFKEYLRTTAFRTYPGEGSDKAGFTTLKDEAKKRGW